MKVKNILSVDIEDRNQAPSEADQDPGKFFPDAITRDIATILDMFGKLNVRATFFISGAVAELIPGMVKNISACGHEIASHGYKHVPVYKMTEAEFEKDLLASINVIKGITGKDVIGYRAPYWSITENSLWALGILERNGIKYDSSIFPIKNYLYGIDGFYRFPGLMKEYSIVEFPGSTVELLGKKIPFGGGFYLRMMPYWMTRACMDVLNREKEPAMLYFHQHELGDEIYPVPLFHKEKFILNAGKSNVLKKIQRSLKEFEFVPICELLSGYQNDEYKS